MQRLTPREQNAILWPIAQASTFYRLWNFRQIISEHAELRRIRRGLRLDDPILEALILTGAHRQPWSSAAVPV